MIYSFKVCKDKISLTGNLSANAGSINYYGCTFAFDEDWKGLERFAVFTDGDLTFTCILSEDKCFIPCELLEKAGTISVGVYGSSLDGAEPLRISTDFSHIVIKEGAYRDGSAPAVPAPELWETYFRQVAETASETAVSTVEQYLTDMADAFRDIDISLSHIIELQNALIGGEAL